jgi:hypothetical protein
MLEALSKDPPSFKGTYPLPPENTHTHTHTHTQPPLLLFLDVCYSLRK